MPLISWPRFARDWRDFGSFVLAAALLTGCAVPVASGLSEDDANRVVVALERASVDTTKEADPASEGRLRVLVPREDAARATITLREEELPPRAAPGVLETMGKGALVPSTATEHAQYVSGLAGELEHSLVAIDGVVAARVHLSLPTPDPLGGRLGENVQKPSASVLLKHRGPSSPVDALAVQRLIGGAVSGLAMDDVAVVMVARPAITIPPEKQIVHVGPVGVTRGSIGVLRLIAGASIVLHLVLFGVALAFYIRARGLREAVAAAQPAPS
jgi:type III secretion protein J